MDDAQIHGSIEQLVGEEHELWERRRPAGNATDADRQRLAGAQGLARPVLGTCSASVERFARRGKTPRARRLDDLDVVEDYEQ